MSNKNLHEDKAKDSAKQILAFDFGTKHIGIAVGQNVSESAEGLCQINATDGIPDWQDIDAIVADWKPDLLLIGLPLNMDGSMSPIAYRAKKFANRLHDRYCLPCQLVDERLSSYEVKQRHSIKSREIDSLAAAVILRTWFVQQTSTH